VKRAGALVIAFVALAGCSQTDSAPEPTPSETFVTQSPSPEPTATSEAPTVTPTSATPSPTRASASATATQASTAAFCAYLKKTAGAQQQVEDPSQFVALVNGALAVAPGAIQEDLTLYAESVQKLADSVTASPKKAAKADQWLSDNEDAIAQAEANLNAYSESSCGRPFITGEGG
jgi:hypothetical protein